MIVATGRRSNDTYKPPVILPTLYCHPHPFVSLTHSQCGLVLTSAWWQLHGSCRRMQHRTGQQAPLQSRFP